MGHLTDDDLVLHYYGELDTGGERHVSTHLAGCGECHRAYVRLQRVMAAVDSFPTPALDEGFERTVWARLERELPRRQRWLSWLLVSPARLAWVGAVLALVAGAFFAGRMSQPPPQGPQVATADQIRQGVLLVDLAEHLDRSQTMLVELVSADASGSATDLAAERERAEELVAANRLYRQAASRNGDAAVTQLLDELERLLVELAASSETLGPEELEQVQQRIAARDLLFKVRVVSSAVKARQKETIRARISG